MSRKPRGFPGFSDFGALYLGRIPVDSAPSWTVDHLCTSSRDLDTKVARIDSYKSHVDVKLKVFLDTGAEALLDGGEKLGLSLPQ